MTRMLLLILGAILMGAGGLFWGCGDAPEANLQQKLHAIQTLAQQARESGVVNMDSIRQEQRSLARSYTHRLDPQNVPEQSLSQAAQLFYHAGRLDSAIAVMKRQPIENRDPVQLFECYWLTDRINQAESLFRDTLRQAYPRRRPVFYSYLFKGYQTIGDYERALTLAAEAFRTLPRSQVIGLALDKAELLWTLGQQQSALNWLNTLKDTYSEDSGALGRIQARENLFLLIGEQAPELEVDKWIGTPATPLQQRKNRVIVLDFWAPWCGPCRALIPHLISLHKQYHDQGLDIIGVTRTYGFFNQLGQDLKDLDADAEVEWLKTFRNQHDIPFPYAVATDVEGGMKNSMSYGVSGIPHVVVIDRDGRVRAWAIGSGSDSEEKISRAVEELITNG